MPTHEEKQKSLARLGEEFLAAAKKMTPDELYRLVLSGDEPASVYLEHIVGHLARVGGQRRLIKKLETAAALGPAEKKPLPALDDDEPYVIRARGPIHPEAPEWYYYVGGGLSRPRWMSGRDGFDRAERMDVKGAIEMAALLSPGAVGAHALSLTEARAHPGSDGM